MPKADSSSTSAKSSSKIDMDQIWSEYKQHGGDALRNQLVEHYLHLVTHGAERLRAKLNVASDTLAGVTGGHRAATMMSLSRKTNEGSEEGEEGGQLHAIEDTKAADPAREAQRRFLQQMLTKGLSRAERLVVTLYYYEEMTMREIGQTLDLSESRVSQMHTEILKRLRTATKDRQESELHEAAAA